MLADIGKLPETPGARDHLPGRGAADLRGPWTGKRPRRAASSWGDLFATLQAMLSALYINDFNLYGRTYRVQAEAQSRFRQSPEDIGRLFVRTGSEQGDDSALAR